MVIADGRLSIILFMNGVTMYYDQPAASLLDFLLFNS